MPPSLLSRFDLIFVLLDTPNPEEDAIISKHILMTHAAGELRQQRESSLLSVSSIMADEAALHITPEISPELFRKYVAYARKNIFPALTSEAIEHIHEYYLALRKKGSDSKSKSIPITTRQEEAMIRLAEASARVRLSQDVMLEDAERATRLMTKCLRTVGLDPKTGEIDVSVWNSGVSQDQRTTIKMLKDIIRDRTGRHTKGEIPIGEILQDAEIKGIEKKKAASILNKMIQKGEILRPKQDHVKLVN
jgi:replicative DNA helicase Mcm